MISNSGHELQTTLTLKTNMPDENIFSISIMTPLSGCFRNEN